MWRLQFQFLLVRSNDHLYKGRSILAYIVFSICNHWRYRWLDLLVELFSNKPCWCICYSEIMSSNFDSVIPTKSFWEPQRSFRSMVMAWTWPELWTLTLSMVLIDVTWWHGLSWQSFVSFFISQSSLSFVILSLIPQPHSREHGDHSVVWTGQSPTILMPIGFGL